MKRDGEGFVLRARVVDCTTGAANGGRSNGDIGE